MQTRPQIWHLSQWRTCGNLHHTLSDINTWWFVACRELSRQPVPSYHVYFSDFKNSAPIYTIYMSRLKGSPGTSVVRAHSYHLLSVRLLIYLLHSHIYLACHMIQYMSISFTPQKLCTEDRGHSGLWKSAQSLCGSDAMFKELCVRSVDRTRFFLSHLRWF